MTFPFHPKSLPLLVALALLPLSALADPVCALGGISQRSAITELCPFKDGLARLQTGYKWGFVDASGKIVIAPQFDGVGDFSEGLAPAQRDEKWGLIDKQGKWVVEPAMEEIGPLMQGLAAATQGGKAGFIDAKGKWIIPATYAYTGNFMGPVAVAHESHEAAVLIDRSGRIVKRFTPDMTVASYASKDGLIGASVKPAQPLLHVDGRKLPFPEGAANWAYQDQHFVATKMVARGSEQVQQYGVVDMAGKWIVAPIFGKIEDFDGKLGIASPVGASDKVRYGLINKKGSYVVKPVYESITRQKDGRFHAVREGVKDKVEFFDDKGKLQFTLDCGELTGAERTGVVLVMTGCQKTWLVHVQDGLLATYAEPYKASIVGEHVLIERERSEELDRAVAFEIYSAAGKRVAASDLALQNFGKGFDTVSVLPSNPGAPALPLAIYGAFRGPVTLLTRDYKLLTRPDWEYDSALLAYMHERDGAALEGPLVMKGKDGFGALDVNGNWAIQPRFSRLSSFRHGVAFATLDGKQVMVDRAGNTYDFPEKAWRFEPTALMEVTGQSDDGSVIYNLATGVLSTRPEPAFRQRGEAAGGLTASEKDSKWGLANAKLEWVVAPAYDDAPVALMHDKKLLGWITQKNYPTASWDGHLYGLLDPQGREVVKPRFNELKLDDKSGLLIATEDGFESVISAAGKMVLAPVNGSMTSLGDGWFTADMTSLHGLLDQRGEWQVAPGRFEFKLDEAGRPYAIRNKGPEKELMDMKGRISTRSAPLALSVGEPSHWWWADEKRGGDSVAFYGFDFKERARIPGSPSGDGYAEGVIAFAPADDKHRGKVGLADDKGKTIGIYDYEAIGPMVDGLAQVWKQVKGPSRGMEPAKRYGFIDRSGKLAVPLTFEHAADFSEKRATVIVNGGLALIDASGKILLRGSWQCGRTPVLMDSKKNVVWPDEARKVTKCARVASLP